MTARASRAPPACSDPPWLTASARGTRRQLHGQPARRALVAQPPRSATSPGVWETLAGSFGSEKTKVSGTVIAFLSRLAPPRQQPMTPAKEEAHCAASAEDNRMSRTPGKCARLATGTKVDVPTTRPRQQDTK